MPVSSRGMSPRALGVDVIKAYAVPCFLLCLFFFFQLVVLPRAFPPSHYDVLGIGRNSSVDEVVDAYDKLNSTWNTGGKVSSATHFIEVRYAYELLKNPLWKRDYDTFGIDEQHHTVRQAKLLYAGDSFLNVKLPLLEDTAWEFDDDDAQNGLNSENWNSVVTDSNPWIVLVYSRASRNCKQFYGLWKRIVYFLDGVANSTVVELGDIRLAMFMAERKPTGQFFFRNGVPTIISLPAGCKRSDCISRYEGDMTVDAITDWFASSVLSLPRILYYTKATLAKGFLSQSGPYKVKVIYFSETGQRAIPFMRLIAQKYWDYASFAHVLWRNEDTSFWWNSLEVEFAPAVVFIKDPGVKPIVIYGPINNSMFADLIEQHKEQELPQLRILTSMKLGCDARGHARSGNDTLSWYCVILAGRVGSELNEMRETMRRLQNDLQSVSVMEEANRNVKWHAAIALSSKRLTFTWLDGEAQEKYCLFYLHSETSYETCGPRRGSDDVPKLFIVRYKKNSTAEDINLSKQPKNLWNMLQSEDEAPASQLVARYNGSYDPNQIIKWVSDTIKDGDTKDLPFFRARTPDLIPEASQEVLHKSIGMKHSFRGFRARVSDYVEDPRVGPVLLVAALMSFGAIWLARSQSATLTQSKDEHSKRLKVVSRSDVPPSITDVEPNDAYQMPFSDSD